MTVYDKAQYHLETIENLGLPDIHAYIHTGFYLGWLIENNLLDGEFFSDIQDEITQFKNGTMTATELFRCLNGVLDNAMLNLLGNRFSEFYFHFEYGRYLHDYNSTLAKNLPSEFHIEDTPENYRTACEFISRRYTEWKKNYGQLHN
jgi:hypothetical protein